MIKQILGSIKHKLIGHRYRIVDSALGGIPLKVYQGTIRQVPDIDDAWFASLAKEAKIIFDIVANIRYSALLANVYGKPENMVLVDPNPLALASAADNLILNNLSDNCRFVAAFVSDTDKDKVKFYTVGRGAAASVYPEHAKTASSANSWFWVPTVTLDELSLRFGLEPDLIKVDVEDAEGMVLNRAKAICKNNAWGMESLDYVAT